MGRPLVLALVASVAVVVVSLVAVSSLDMAAMFADDADAVHDAGVTEQPLAPKRQMSERRAPSNGITAIRILNTGTVDTDSGRHDERVQELAQAAAAPGDAVTADDDLDQAGSVADWYPAQGKTYRTVCVRLCDGALTPISFSTTRDRFALDALRCRKSCGSPAKLYIQSNPASGADGLVDLDGRSYAVLDTAFKFRTSYDSGCTCRAHAWESLAQARHRIFDIQDRLRRGRQVTQARMARLKLAAAKSVRVAAWTTRSPDAIVTGTANRPVTSDRLTNVRVSPDGIVEPSEGHGGEAIDTRLAVAKLSGKVGKPKHGKAQANAKSKSKQAKPIDFEPLLVLFGQPSGKSGGPKSKLVLQPRTADNLQRADMSTRLYDGNDWRISNYEPL